MIVYKFFRDVKCIEFGATHWLANTLIGSGFTMMGYIKFDEDPVSKLFFVGGLIALTFSLFQKKKTIIFSQRDGTVTVKEGFLLIPFIVKSKNLYSQTIANVKHSTTLRNTCNNRGVEKHAQIRAEFSSGGGLLLASGRNSTGTFMAKRLAKLLDVEFEKKIIDNTNGNMGYKEAQKDYMDYLKDNN